MKLYPENPSMKAIKINTFDKQLHPLGFVNNGNYDFYHPDYKVRLDLSATDPNKAVEVAVKAIYNAGLNYGIESTQKVIRNALGMEK